MIAEYEYEQQRTRKRKSEWTFGKTLLAGAATLVIMGMQAVALYLQTRHGVVVLKVPK